MRNAIRVDVPDAIPALRTPYTSWSVHIKKLGRAARRRARQLREAVHIGTNRDCRLCPQSINDRKIRRSCSGCGAHNVNTVDCYALQYRWFPHSGLS